MKTIKKAQLPRSLGEPWIEALRSGNYEQTTGQLKKNNCYCCLGVYCVVNNIEIAEAGLIAQGYEGYDFLNEYLGPTLVCALYEMNDIKKKNFTEIADFIEQNVEFTD